MNTLTATYRIVTPMFLGDANQNATDIRPPSVKGALRFWWRAMMWGQIRNSSKDDVEALTKLHRQEAELFGVSAGVYVDQKSKKDELGQGKFLLQVSHDKFGEKEKIYPQNGTGSGYLGYGLMETNQQRHREAIKEGKEFTLHLILKPNITESDKKNLEQTLELFGLVGGLGSRSRRGFGSIEKVGNSFKTIKEYQAKIDSFLLLGKNVQNYPPYAALSFFSKYKLLSEENTAKEAQNKAGNIYKKHRGQESELRGKQKLPFGIPLKDVTEKHFSSPLFFHIHPIANKFVCNTLFLPSIFHHEFVSESGTDKKSLNKFYKVVEEFVL